MPKKRIGRPRLPKGTAKQERLIVRLLKAEDKEIAAAAKRAGKSKSKWVREILLREAATTRT